MFFTCSKKDPYLLTRSIPLLRYLMNGDNINIEKRCIICFIQLYRILLNVSRCGLLIIVNVSSAPGQSKGH